MAGWTLDDIPWQRFDAARVDPEIVKLVKAASMVEANAGDYRTYLINVFADDARLRRAIEGWTAEEKQHGAALARWAALADPGFDFAAGFRTFTRGYSIPLDAHRSVRGSRAGELIARCMVETGTSSFYTALAEAAAEPVLKEICRRIADDERAHYWMFHRHMRRYLERERLGFLARLRIALGRIAESEDDELAFAYFAANGDAQGYDRRRHALSYERGTLAIFTPAVARGAVEMILTAVGLDGGSRLARLAAALVWRGLRLRRSWIAHMASSQ